MRIPKISLENRLLNQNSHNLCRYYKYKWQKSQIQYHTTYTISFMLVSSKGEILQNLRTHPLFTPNNEILLLVLRYKQLCISLSCKIIYNFHHIHIHWC